MKRLLLGLALMLAGCASAPSIEYGTTEWADIASTLPACSNLLQDAFTVEANSNADMKNPEVFEFYFEEFEHDNQCQLPRLDA